MKSLVTICLLTALATLSLSANASDFSFTNAAFRIGIDDENGLSLSSYEIYGTVDTPWNWSLTEKLRAEIDIEAGIGALTAEGETAGTLHIGPALELSYGECPVSLTLSTGPTVLSEDTFDDRDLGGHFHFTSGIGLNWQACEKWNVGYRYQHTSNANIDTPNPGLDMHTLSLSYTY
jgi:hypothetical protein